MTTKIKILIASIASIVCIGIASVIGITFYNSKISSLVVDTSNAKLVYDINEDFDYEGLIVNTKTNSGKLNMIEGFSIDSSSFQKGVIGQYDILVTYNNLNTKYVVEIKDKGTLAITKNYKFFVGQDFESNSPELTQTTSTGSTNLIDDYKIEDFNTDAVGQHTAKIQANGFTYDVDYSVVDNYNYLQNLVNIWKETNEDKIYNYGYYHYFNANTYSEEIHTVTIDEDSTWHIVMILNETRISYAWATIDGALYQEIEGEKTTYTQYSSQEEAINAINWDNPDSPFNSYMYFVNLTETGIQNSTIESYKTEHDENLIKISITSQYNFEGENLSLLYEAYYDAKNGLLKEIVEYISGTKVNEYKFNFDCFNKLPDYEK